MGEAEGDPGASPLEGAITEGEGDREECVEEELASTSGQNQEKSESLPQRGSEDRKKLRKRKYVLKGGASALAVQLFGIDDAYEMRLVPPL